MQASVPDSYLVERYLEEIAKIYDIKWKSDLIEHVEEEKELKEDIDNDDDDNNDRGSGGQKEVCSYYKYCWCSYPN